MYIYSIFDKSLHEAKILHSPKNQNNLSYKMSSSSSANLQTRNQLLLPLSCKMWYDKGVKVCYFDEICRFLILFWIFSLSFTVFCRVLDKLEIKNEAASFPPLFCLLLCEVRTKTEKLFHLVFLFVLTFCRSCMAEDPLTVIRTSKPPIFTLLCQTYAQKSTIIPLNLCTKCEYFQ